jgi:menaquinol-cytochrome c reductase iron-sulfur subunit
MENPSQTEADVQGEPAGAADSRRGFLTKTFALALGAGAYAVPVLAGLVALLNPLRLKSQAGQFRRLASLDMVPEDGTPLKVSVIADRTDAWNRSANQPIGAVFLQRTEQGELKAMNVRCPHLGCSVDYQPSQGRYFCPCHKAAFDLTGKRTDADSMSPRDLDELEVELRNGGEVWVRFQNFKLNTSAQVPEA